MSDYKVRITDEVENESEIIQTVILSRVDIKAALEDVKLTLPTAPMYNTPNVIVTITPIDTSEEPIVLKKGKDF